MASAELTTWLLGIGGYTGIITSLAILYLNPRFPRSFLPLLVFAPVLSASAFYLFFQTLYLLLGFMVTVFQAMLNENITIIIIASIFIGGETLFVSYIIYRYLFMKSPEEQNITADEVIDDTEDAEGTDTEEAEALSDNENTEDNIEGAADTFDMLNTAAVAAVTADTAPVDTCVNCDDDCIKCMPALIPSNILGLNTGITTTQTWGDMIAEEDVKID